MTIDPPAAEPAGTSRRWNDLLLRNGIGARLEVATDAERMAPIVEAFLTADRSPG